MTTVASNASAPIPEKTEKSAVVRPEKPDEEAFKKASEVVQKEHDAIRQKLNDVKAKIEGAKPGGRDPRQQELRDQLSAIRQQVATKKGNVGKIQDQIKNLQDSINTRVKEVQTKQKFIGYKSVADLEAQVAKLDAGVSSGKMKIVDEKKALSEISGLNKKKRDFATIEEMQKSIDSDKTKLKELKEKKQDPELVELNKKYETLQTELNELRANQESVQKNINTLRDERTKLQKEQNEKWDELKKLRDEFHQNRIAFREYSKEARRIKEEKYQKQRQEQEQARKKAIAEERMEAASQPAFLNEIMICEGLIGFFDPSSAEAARKAKNVVAPRELAAKAQRTVDASALKGKVLVKEEEDYFIGGKTKKKGKKAKKADTDAASPAEAPAPSGKLSLNAGTLAELSHVKVDTPASQAGVVKTLESLRERLQWYKDNQQKVTQENIAKAKKELEKFEAEGSDGPEIPSADVVKTEKATSGTATPATTEPEVVAKEDEPKPEAEEKKEEEAAPAPEEEKVEEKTEEEKVEEPAAEPAAEAKEE
ncbi:hypothetical protein EDC01DRAFT_718584 [Geopyxis carbonaria]|nr:hypothetical protein EDC01DRAFT_718584 [Geopyxis carbonaria]